jgi:outer membrane receptor protein involved in Fe transport
VFDLNADISNDRWTVRFYIKNLTDKRVYTNLFGLANAATGEVTQVRGVPVQPRTIGAGVRCEVLTRSLLAVRDGGYDV